MRVRLSVPRAGYQRNAFHNSLHGTEVARSLSCLLIGSQLYRHMTPWQVCRAQHRSLPRSPLGLTACSQVLGCLLAGLAHDLDHPGVSNAFLVNSCEPSWRIFVLARDPSVGVRPH
jgi:hypothetical protein